jgi:hypothetical protein
MFIIPRFERMNDKSILDEQNWSTLVGKSGKLLPYAARMIRTRYCGLLAHGFTVEMLAPSVVSDTIDAVYHSRRQWNREAYPDFDIFLFGIIDSKLHSLLKRHLANKERQGYVEVALDEEITPSVSDTQQMLDGELAKLIEAWGEDLIMARVIEGLQDGLKPSQISQKYSLQMRDVRQCIQNLNRRITGAYSRAKVYTPWKK